MSFVATRLGLQRLLGRQALLEAAAGLAAQAEICDVRWMFGPTQLAASISTRVVLGSDLGARAAHDAGDRRRALVVLDDEHLGVERARPGRRGS